MYLVNLIDTRNGDRATAVVPFEWNDHERAKLASGEYSHELGRDFMWRMAKNWPTVAITGSRRQQEMMARPGPYRVESVQVGGRIVYLEEPAQPSI